jgi:hypothetical protein
MNSMIFFMNIFFNNIFPTFTPGANAFFLIFDHLQVDFLTTAYYIIVIIRV